MTNEPSKKQSNRLETVGNADTMNLHNILYVNIIASPYFKALYEKKTYHEVVDEIYNNGTHASTAFCLLYKLWTLKLTIKQIEGLINHTDSPYIRALGFMYLRYVCKPADLWDWFYDYIDDDEEIQIERGPKPRTISMGKLCRDLLSEPKWLGTILPRIPVPIARDLAQKLKENPPQGAGAAAVGEAPYVPAAGPSEPPRHGGYGRGGGDYDDRGRDRGYNQLQRQDGYGGGRHDPRDRGYDYRDERRGYDHGYDGRRGYDHRDDYRGGRGYDRDDGGRGRGGYGYDDRDRRAGYDDRDRERRNGRSRSPRRGGYDRSHESRDRDRDYDGRRSRTPDRGHRADNGDGRDRKVSDVDPRLEEGRTRAAEE
ncbi:hypothetical protein HDV00_001179 [Rhizophlyctis rosea]|nr:hypothetical protein HDV00_001179 [Rhizophlyctis rosea]